MKLSGASSVEIAAATERCRAVLVDLGGYADWFPGVKTAEVVDAADGAPTARLLFSTGRGVVPDTQCVLRYDASAPTRLVPSVLEGALSIGGPGWTLEALAPERTRVTYDVTIEMAVPGGFITERAISGTARKLLIELPVQRLRGYLEGD